jgi:hypothetical protein
VGCRRPTENQVLRWSFVFVFRLFLRVHSGRTAALIKLSLKIERRVQVPGAGKKGGPSLVFQCSNPDRNCECGSGSISNKFGNKFIKTLLLIIHLRFEKLCTLLGMVWYGIFYNF